MRQSQRSILLKILYICAEGILWRELIGTHTWISTSEKGVETTVVKVTRSTAARHLSQLIKENIVQKVPEPRKKGERGRQPQRYKLTPGVQLGFKINMIFTQDKNLTLLGFEKELPSGKKILRPFLYRRDKDGFHKISPEYAEKRAEGMKKYRLWRRRVRYKQLKPPPYTQRRVL